MFRLDQYGASNTLNPTEDEGLELILSMRLAGDKENCRIEVQKYFAFHRDEEPGKMLLEVAKIFLRFRAVSCFQRFALDGLKGKS